MKKNGLVFEFGYYKWYKDDLLHREGDLPAIESNDGNKFWYKEGKLHREGDLPAVEYNDGTKKWYKEGKLHREGDMPAYYDRSYGSLLQYYWYKEGRRHREGGKPAIEWSNGKKEWWYNGTKLEVSSNQEALRLIKMKALW